MGHKCFISWKKEDVYYKNELSKILYYSDMIDKSLDRKIDSQNGDYIMQVIRQDYLKDSTVTIFLIGEHSSENEGIDFYGDKNYFIKQELAASLYDGTGNTRNGILGVVLPSMYDKIFQGVHKCDKCGGFHNLVKLDDTTVIREFYENYYIKPHDKCSYSEMESYCVICKWDEFVKDKDKFIELAFYKRTAEISKKVRIRNLR